MSESEVAVAPETIPTVNGDGSDAADTVAAPAATAAATAAVTSSETIAPEAAPGSRPHQTITQPQAQWLWAAENEPNCCLRCGRRFSRLNKP